MVKARASKYRGVYRCGTKWKAQIQIDGIQYYLGVFDDQEGASEAYKAFARKHGRLYMIEEGTSLKDKTDDSDDAEEFDEESNEGKQEDMVAEEKDSLIHKVVYVEGLEASSPMTFNSPSKDELFPVTRKPTLIIPMEKKMKMLFSLKLLKILLGKCIYYSSLNNLHLYTVLTSHEAKGEEKTQIQSQSMHLSQCVQLLVNEVLRIVSMTSSHNVIGSQNPSLFAGGVSNQAREAFQLHFQSISTANSSCPSSPSKQMKTS